MQVVQVRGLVAADHADWAVLWRQYQVFYEVDIAPAVSDVTWARLLAPGEPVFGAVALAGTVAIGLVHWIFHRSTWSMGDACYLQDLFVAPTQRGAGVGRRLIEHVYAAAQAANCAEVYWLTHERNATAMQLYDKVAVRSGFVQYQKML